MTPERNKHFMRRCTPKNQKLDPSPHALTAEERDYIDRCFCNGSHVSMAMIKKMMRLYDERTAACIQLMREAGHIHEHNPEFG